MEGAGRAYIGYSEAMSVMGERVSEVDFRPFSMTDDDNIPVFYVDAAAVNAKISEEKRPLALELLNLLISKDVLVRASVPNGNPQYLFSSRYSVYDTLAPEYAIYSDMRAIALTPGAYVFRMKPDGNAYMDEVRKNADVLPSLTE